MSKNKTGELIEQACEKLPDGAEILIELGTGSAVVRLFYRGTEYEYPSNLESFDEILSDAIEFARSDEFGT